MTPSGSSRLAWAVALAVVAAAALPVWGQAEPEVYFLEPQPGAVVEGPPWVRVTGRARGPKLEPARAFDVMLILDTSGSTANSSSGWLGWRGRGGFSGGSILAAEVTAALNFLGQADPSTTRIGLITFAGDYQPVTGNAVGGSSNAWVRQPLTVHYDLVRAALQQVLRRGPDGGTDMAAGLRLAARELLALHGAASSARPDARKVALLLTDGYPTLPFGLVADQDPGDVEVTLSAARVAAKGGILVHTFCLGAEALSKPVACSGIARLTGGRAQLLETPADVVDLLPRTPLGNVELVSVRNATTGQPARSLTVTPDGTFAAEVSLAPGENRLVVDLLGGVGVRRSAALVVRYGQPDVNVQVDRAPPEARSCRSRSSARIRRADFAAEGRRPNGTHHEHLRARPAGRARHVPARPLLDPGPGRDLRARLDPVESDPSRPRADRVGAGPRQPSGGGGSADDPQDGRDARGRDLPGSAPPRRQRRVRPRRDGPEAAELLHGLKRHLWILATVGSLAPFIGLLGTVLGIVRSFHNMAITGQGGFGIVAAGISEALIATAAGLVVAIVALAAYNWILTIINSFGAFLRFRIEELAQHQQDKGSVYGDVSTSR